MAPLFREMAKIWGRFWSTKLVKRLDVKGSQATFSFKIYQNDDGERTVRFGFYTPGETCSFSIQPDELDRLVEAASEARAQLRAAPENPL